MLLKSKLRIAIVLDILMVAIAICTIAHYLLQAPILPSILVGVILGVVYTTIEVKLTKWIKG